jgi:hypothetical protein
MDKTNEWKTLPAPPVDDEHDLLAKRLTETWAISAAQRRSSGDQILQKLPGGRVRVVEVQSTRSRRRPVVSRD